MEWVVIARLQLAPPRDSTSRYDLRRTQLRGGRLAGEALCLSMTMLDMPASSRASALLQEIRHNTIPCDEHDSVGAGLLAKAWCLSMTMVDMPASSRASALLQGIRHPAMTCGDHDSVGAGLLAKAWCLSMTMLDMPASSRASALLQAINTPICCGKPHP
jgi:uncharacterized protein YceK